MNHFRQRLDGLLSELDAYNRFIVGGMNTLLRLCVCLLAWLASIGLYHATGFVPLRLVGFLILLFGAGYYLIGTIRFGLKYQEFASDRDRLGSEVQEIGEEIDEARREFAAYCDAAVPVPVRTAQIIAAVYAIEEYAPRRIVTTLFFGPLILGRDKLFDDIDRHLLDNS